MTRLAALCLLTLAAAMAATSASEAATQPLYPGVTYSSEVQFTPHGPVALHVALGPRPVGLYRLRPVLSNEAILNRETLSSMQKRLSPQATSVGVNGDYFSLDDGRPSGGLIRDGVLVASPSENRSSAGITLDGALEVGRVKFVGTWRGAGQKRTFSDFNEGNVHAISTSRGHTPPRGACFRIRWIIGLSMSRTAPA